MGLRSWASQAYAKKEPYMDCATPNLPSRDFDATRAFYAALGFEANFQSAQWMILSRAGVTLEFFLHPNLNPLESWFSCCLRLDDLTPPLP